MPQTNRFFVKLQRHPWFWIWRIWSYSCNAFWAGVEKVYGDLYFVFKLRIFFSSGKFRGREIRYYVDREVFCLWDEDSADAYIADLFPFEWSAISPLCPLGLFREGFWTACVINGKKSVFCGCSSSLLLNDFQSCAFDGLEIPFWIWEKVLKFLLLFKSFKEKEFVLQNHKP